MTGDVTAAGRGGVEPRPPGEFVARLERELGADLPAFLAALAAPEAGLRANGIRLSADAFEALSPFPVRRMGFPLDGFTYDPAARPGRHPYHAAGVYYLQDPGAMIVGALVGAKPGERVLDVAAAPGGKATQLAAAMANTGLLVTNDVSRQRAVELARNLERCGVRNAVVTSDSPDRLAARLGAFFDRVLVDAPCSGESMFHKSEVARSGWSPATVAGCARRQSELLRQAADLVRPDGILVYSTCTFARAENEDVVSEFLNDRPDFVPWSLPPVAGADPVEVAGGGSEAGATGPAAYRLWPHRVPGAGHFVAALRRVEGPEPAGASGRVDEPRAARAAVSRMLDFVSDLWPAQGDSVDRVVVRGEALYASPAGVPDLGGLRVVRPGIELGRLRGARFEPAHGLALAMPGTPARVVELTLVDPRLPRYLAGHPIEADGPAGWVVVTVDGFALGWGKRVGTTVKNHYPRGLRRPD